MKDTEKISPLFSWLFGLIVFAIGIMNLLWIHPVPAVVYLLLSSLYFPPTNDFLKNRLRFSLPLLVKIILGVFILWFTLGVSDLGDMID